MADDIPDPVAATLASTRERSSRARLPEPHTADVLRSAADVPVLLGVIGRALGRAGEWEQEAARLGRLAEAEADPWSRTAISLRVQAFEDCARGLREAITAALAKEAGDGG